MDSASADHGAKAPETNNERGYKGPLTVYVLWHPDCPDGRTLAESVYRWFRAPSTDVWRSGVGVPVYYRTEPFAPVLRLPRDHGMEDDTRDGNPVEHLRRIHLNEARINIIVPLIDANMVADELWQNTLYRLAVSGQHVIDDDNGVQIEMLPVQLHHSASRLDEVVTRTNAIRLDRWSDPDDECRELRIGRRCRRLRRYLTQALVRLCREEQHQGNPSMMPRSVFLSHAKGDREQGPGIAERLRDTIARHGQLDAFYDESDLPWGQEWEEPMLDAAGRGAAAMVAVVSDKYASRYWCRKEVSAARRPRRLADLKGNAEDKEKKAPTADDQIWWVQPMVAVDTLSEQWTRVIPELGTVPFIRWDDDRDGEILDRLMLEALLTEFQARYARGLYDRWSERPEIRPPHFLTWVPDPYTLLEMHSAKKEESPFQPNTIVVYPGHGLMPTEEDRLTRYFEEVRFMSVEDHRIDPVDSPSAPSGRSSTETTTGHPLVALSAGDSEDLAALGYGPEHVDEAVMRIVRALLGAGKRIAYGGILRQEKGFTEVIIDAAASVFPAGAKEVEGEQKTTTSGPDAESPTRLIPHTPFVNYQAWPYYLNTSIEVRAEQHGVCTFEDVDPYGHPPGDPADMSATERAWLTGKALSKMRLRVAQAANLMVVLGGKTYGWAGTMPGIAEEVLCALEANTPVVILGAFGGMARHVARFLLDPDAELPDVLTFRHHEEHPRNERLVELLAGAEEAGKKSTLEDRYNILAAELMAYRERLHDHEVWHASALLELMATDSVGFIRRTLLDGFRSTEGE